MTYLIAAAGTGGHVYPGLAVAEQLMASGVDQGDILFLGGDRMEAEVIPAEGFPFLRLELQGLVRKLSMRNLRLPRVVLTATRRAMQAMADRKVAAVLCMGGYVTVPVAIAARRSGVPFYLHEQNFEAGLANRLVGRWADRAFVTFPGTRGLNGTVIGYPLRAALSGLDTAVSRPAALDRYADCGRAIGLAGQGDDDALAVRKLIDGLYAFRDRLEVPSMLEFGINRDAFAGALDQMAEDALRSGAPNNNPRIANKEEIIDLFLHAWSVGDK